MSVVSAELVNTPPALEDVRLLMLVGGFMVEVERDMGQFLASEPRAGAFGEGDSVEEAVADLMATLRGFWADLVDHHNMLSPEMAERLRYLSAALPR